MDAVRSERWEEVVNSIDSSNSSRRRGAPTINFRNDLFPHCNIPMRLSCLTSLLACHTFHYVRLKPLMKCFTVAWFSQIITHPSSTSTSDFLTKRWDIVTCSFVFNVDFVKYLNLPSLSNMEVGTGECSRVRTVFVIMSRDCCSPSTRK